MDLFDWMFIISGFIFFASMISALKLAKKFNYKFLANDLYREYRNDYGKEWIKKNRLTCV